MIHFSDVTGSVRSRTRRTVVATVLATAAVTLAACSPQLAGSAAVLGDVRISDNELSAQVDEVTSALNLEPSVVANQIVLDRLIRGAVIDVIAQREKVSVTDGQVQEFLTTTEAQVGGPAQLKTQLLQIGVPESQMVPFARTFVLQQEIAKKLAPGKSAEEQGQIISALAVEISEELDIQVSPRFGTWDPAQFKVGPVPNTLSVPAPSSQPVNPLIPSQ